jgi:hypothetical protein
MSVFLDAAQASPYVPPQATPPGDLYFTYRSPAGESFVTSAANVEAYLRVGCTVTGEQTISDSDTYRDLVSPGTNLPPASGTATPPVATSTTETTQ